jgi:hypothetical protein
MGNQNCCACKENGDNLENNTMVIDGNANTNSFSMESTNKLKSARKDTDENIYDKNGNVD